ncbi:DNA-binding protein rfxank, putative, partial [Ixodes scapularis]
VLKRAPRIKLPLMRFLALLLFQPSTVLTNLQRGNVPTQTPAVPCALFSEMPCNSFCTATGSERIEMKDEGGLTPLLWASAHGQLSTVRLLVDRGARVQATGNRGETALLLASAGGHSHVVRHLIQHGARPDQADQVGASSL